jgi:hypothetical protein
MSKRGELRVRPGVGTTDVGPVETQGARVAS